MAYAIFIIVLTATIWLTGPNDPIKLCAWYLLVMAAVKLLAVTGRLAFAEFPIEQNLSRARSVWSLVTCATIGGFAFYALYWPR